MDIEGTYTLQAAPEEVWSCLMDQQTLCRTIPGLERLETVGEHTCAFTLHIRHAPLRGTYSGQAVVIEQHYPLLYRMTIEGEGQPSKIHGECSVQLSAYNENTVIAYKTALHLGARLPTNLVKGTIKVLIQQFFTSLAEHLRTTSRTYAATLEDTRLDSEFAQTGNARFTDAPTPRQPALLHTLVHRLRLGDNDPLLEEQWVTRLRRIGFVALLLLLVWVGTRLPGKPASRKVIRP